MRLGIHASVRRGLAAALEEAARLDCRAVQIFPHRPGEPPVIPPEGEALAFRRLRAGKRVDYLAVHSVYQPNIASTNERIRERSRRSLLEELRFSQAVGADALVIHSGNYSADSNLADGIRRSGEAVRQALSQAPGATKIVIENVAGGDRRIGGRFEELRALLDEIGAPERTGLCLDTAHTFAAGFPIQTPAGLEDALAEWDKVLGLGRLELFHFNDSAAPLGSHRDIHEHIGRGLIGEEMLARLARDPRFEGKAGVIETPKQPAGSDAANLARLRGF